MLKYRSLIIMCLMIVCALAVVSSLVAHHSAAWQRVRVDILDVGQGDAVLLSRGMNQILIDGGPEGIVTLEEIGSVMPFWDRTLELVIVTHLDQDHIDGLVDVLASYDVREVWLNESAKDTKIAEIFRSAIEGSGAERRTVFTGVEACIASFACLQVVYPHTTQGSAADENDASIATLFTVGQERFYFGGDLSSEVEDTLSLERVSVLKASHHGANSSTSADFLYVHKPRDVVVSAGTDNPHGHPHVELLERVQHAGARILSTATHGRISYDCTPEHCTTIVERAGDSWELQNSE